jgi:hypothetical protein
MSLRSQPNILIVLFPSSLGWGKFGTLNLKMSYVVGSLKFKLKKNIFTYLRKVKRLIQGGKVVTVDHPDYSFILALCKYHPRWGDKSLNGKVNFQKRHDNGIDIIRKDGTLMDITTSQKFLSPCIGKYGAKQCPKRYRLQRFQSACRYEVKDQIESAHKTLPRVSAITCKPMTDRGHIDHKFEFRHLLDNFICENSIDVSTIAYRGDSALNMHGFKDRALAQKWKTYHRINATLRRLTAKENLSRPRPDLRRC